MSAPNTTVTQLNEVDDIVKTVADQRIFPVILESMLLSLFTALMLFYGIRYYSRGGYRQALGAFFVSLGLYTLCAICWALDIWILWKELYQVIPSRSMRIQPAISINQAQLNSNGNIKFARNLFELVVFTLSDTIALWRTYVVYGRPRWLKVSFGVIMGLYLILLFFDILLNNTLFLSKGPPRSVVDFVNTDGATLRIAEGLSAASWAALTQVLATSMIAWKAFLHRREVEKLLPIRRGLSDPSRLVAILYLVVETGSVYTIFWTVYVFLDHFGTVCVAAWTDFWITQISGIFPTLIVVIVSLRASILEQSVMNASNLATVSLHFATNGNLEDLPPSRSHGIPRAETPSEVKTAFVAEESQRDTETQQSRSLA